LELARQIITQGCVVTEFPIGAPPAGKNFPRRNRVMSGLALGVLVVEAGERSGALITTSYAAEHGRDVFAVPSNIFNQAGRGTNRLIQDGAKLVMGAQDVLDEIDLAHTQVETRLRLSSRQMTPKPPCWICSATTPFTSTT
jgi:DNA processing protein